MNGERFVIAAWILAAVVTLAFWGGVLFIGLHFLARVW